MANSGRTAAEALRGFADRLNRVLAKTITQRQLVPLILPGRGGEVTGTMNLSFRAGGLGTSIPLESKYGTIYLFLGQLCETRLDTRHVVRTASYKYTLTEDLEGEPQLRWEYERRWPHEDSRWCRHHLQGAINLGLGDERVTLSELHLPTGYIPIEDVIRFCIHDLGVRPIDDDWHETLEESYDAFRNESSPPR